MDLTPAVAASASLGKAVDAYKKAVSTAALVTTYTMLARGMARELLPDELRAAAAWAASLLRARIEPPRAERRTVVIKRVDEDGCNDNSFYRDARAYLAGKIDPSAMTRICLGGGGGAGRRVLSMDEGDSMTDVFDGVEFVWTSVAGDGNGGKGGAQSQAALEVSFDAEHTDMALGRYVPFITAEAEQARQRDCDLQIYMNDGGSWQGIVHHHPATFDTLAMDPALKQSVVDDLGRFLKRKDYYRRIGKAWKRGYLLYGPPGTGKSSLVAAIANHLRFDLYDLDIADVYSDSCLQRLLIGMPNKSILVIEDIDCCFTAKSREHGEDDKQPYHGEGDYKVTLSGLLNFIDGLWSTSGEERIIIFTTNYKDRLDPALLRPGRMDMHVYMGYCGWEAFKKLAHNYFVIEDHELFPAIQELLAGVEVTPAEVSEMLLRREDVDAALAGLVEFLHDKRRKLRDCSKEAD